MDEQETKTAEPQDDLRNPSYYINRELSTIEFNRRVLMESFNIDHPLLERTKFNAIFSSNMDEFFMVRVAGIRQQVVLGVPEAPPDGLTPREQLVSIHRAVDELYTLQMRNWRDELNPNLKKNGIHLLKYDDLRSKQKKNISRYFEQELFPVLTPLAFDPGHPFPHISNLSLNLAVVVRDPEKGDTHFARVKVPSTLPRLVPLNPLDPDELLQPKIQKFVWLEDVIIANLDRLFPGMVIEQAHPFRVTRNSDLELQEDEADDLLATMEANLRKRPFGFVVRLEIASSCPDRIRDILMANLEATALDIYTIDGPLGMSSLFQIMSIDRPELKDPPLQPITLPPLHSGDNIFRTLKRQDALLHHPYDSFNPVIDFIEEAANDKYVLAIKQTLYRVDTDSPILEALIKARQNGKQVTVLVELKARFDEESNIEWARALENAGVHVVYGLIGLKTHSKVTLVVRREREGLKRFVHLGTGNYNTSTARVYTDIGFMTTDQKICTDISELFNVLTGYSNQSDYRKMLVAPVSARAKLTKMIEEETKLGEKGEIIFKINHLVDAKMIRALYRASMAGVKVDLTIRGICCLRPGLPGISDNIIVRSVIGRFLEHTRIFMFGNSGKPKLYAGSADLMPRNLDRRIETIFPIENDMLKKEIIEHILHIYQKDTAKSYLLKPGGQYVPTAQEIPAEDELFSAQEWYLKNRTTHLQPVGLA
ncbi:MAG: polyphosphate kinase 1 [Anaerolineae bacterium]